MSRPQLVHVDPQQVHDRQEATDYSVWSDTTLEEALEEPVLEEKPHSDERQIGLDTDRSFVLYPVGEHSLIVHDAQRLTCVVVSEGVSSREKLQSALNRLIVSVFRRRPRLHYFQVCSILTFGLVLS